MSQERETADQLAQTRPMSLRAPTVPFNPISLEWRTRCDADRASVIRNDGTDFFITDKIIPMIRAAFERYTVNGKGGDVRGLYVPWKRDIFDQTAGKTIYMVAQEHGVPLAALRVVKSWVEPFEPVIPAVALMAGHEWPDPTKTRFAEVDLFALSSRVTRERGLVLQRKLYEEVMKLARVEGFEHSIYAILGHVKGFVEESGIKIQEIPGTHLNLGSDSAREIYVRYPRFWTPGLFPEYNRPGGLPEWVLKEYPGYDGGGVPALPPKLYFFGG